MNIEVEDTAERINGLPTSTVGPEIRRKSSYLQSRLEITKQRQDHLYKELEEARQQAEISRRKVQDLRRQQAKTEEKVLNRNSALDCMRESLKRSQEDFEREKAAVKKLRKDSARMSETIRTEEKSIKTQDVYALQVERQMSGLASDAKGKAARQAYILTLKPWEIETLAHHAISNRELEKEILRIVEGKATKTMERDVKSKLFDILTDISQIELRDLLDQVLTVREELINNDGFGEGDDCSVEEEPSSGEELLNSPATKVQPLESTSSKAICQKMGDREQRIRGDSNPAPKSRPDALRITFPRR